ncbi:MAG: hypothetical protein JXB14_05880 [Candidatus Altiarchaeota archaeon]|nr:hypothetical protein [Candidatus Altiarchaeota archaeon]
MRPIKLDLERVREVSGETARPGRSWPGVRGLRAWETADMGDSMRRGILVRHTVAKKNVVDVRRWGTSPKKPWMERTIVRRHGKTLTMVRKHWDGGKVKYIQTAKTRGGSVLDVQPTADVPHFVAGEFAGQTTRFDESGKVSERSPFSELAQFHFDSSRRLSK